MYTSRELSALLLKVMFTICIHRARLVAAPHTYALIDLFTLCAQSIDLFLHSVLNSCPLHAALTYP
jgi:hypothetical protein